MKMIFKWLAERRRRKQFEREQAPHRERWARQTTIKDTAATGRVDYTDGLTVILGDTATSVHPPYETRSDERVLGQSRGAPSLTFSNHPLVGWFQKVDGTRAYANPDGSVTDTPKETDE